MRYASTTLVTAALLLGAVPAWGQAPTAKADPELKTIDQKFAYAYGLQFGRGMKQRGVDLDADAFAKGIKDSLAGKASMTDEQVMQVLEEFKQVLAARQAEASRSVADKNLKDGRAFLEANKSKPGVKVLPSGLQYKVLKEGTGKSPTAKDTFVANYRGTRIDGTEFDSSYKRNEPLELGVGEVIKGWTEALQLMKVGDKWQLFIPSELAYGDNPRKGGVIQPNDVLIFEMELLGVK
jgi:FKBP-type peptidyl-prolyl cis-trans isomerase